MWYSWYFFLTGCVGRWGNILQKKGLCMCSMFVLYCGLNRERVGPGGWRGKRSPATVSMYTYWAQVLSTIAGVFTVGKISTMDGQTFCRFFLLFFFPPQVPTACTAHISTSNQWEWSEFIFSGLTACYSILLLIFYFINLLVFFFF